MEPAKTKTNMPWHFTDPNPDRELREIAPVSLRALSWLARASQDTSFPHNRIVQIAGGARILGSLEYHHQNFMQQVKGLEPYYTRHAQWLNSVLGKMVSEEDLPTLREAEQRTKEVLNHEAIAYINRLGQFFTFSRSLRVEAAMPRASELMLFRHKHTAHRSVDAPKKEDTPHFQEVHAMSFTFHFMSIASFPVFQILNSNKVVTFHMSDDHRTVMDEAFEALQAIHFVSA
jgi:hypothetical protein